MDVIGAKATPALDFRALFESAPGLYLVLAPDLTIVAASDAYLRATMTKREAILGRRLFDIFPGTPDAASADGVRNLKASLDRVQRSRTPDTMAVQKSDVRRPESEGGGIQRRFWIPVNSPVLDAAGDIRYIIHHVEDVTEFSQANLRLAKANDELAAAQEAAKRALTAKGEFVSRMSHDLRTPLNAILGFAQVLELDPLHPEQQDSLKHILRGGRHLLELVNEVLDISRIEAGRLSLSLEPVAIAESVNHAVERIRPLAEQRGITITVATPLDIHALADRRRLNEILFNLLSNAIKYNREQGSVRVVSQRLEPGRVSIVVSDTGAGIRPEKLPLLFTPFERLGLEQCGVEGTGLGLALAKGLAEAMNGAMHVESVLDQGTSFRVDLPAGAPAAARRDAIEKADPDHAWYEGTILYVEDNLSNLRLMQRLLVRRPGVELLHAPDGRGALSMLRERRPALVLLDLHLPDCSGEEVLHQICQDPATRDIPVAVLSADATPAQKQRLLLSGARTYITKPFDIRDILQLIDGVLGASHTS